MNNTMPQTAIDLYAQAVRRATRNAYQIWRRTFTWDEVNSFAWELAVEHWREWDGPGISNPGGNANRRLTNLLKNKCAAEARNLGHQQKRGPDGKQRWVAPKNYATDPHIIDVMLTEESVGADMWIDGERISREEMQEHVRILARNFANINLEADRLDEPKWEQFSDWSARNERARRIRMARRTAEMALAMYAYEVLREAA